MTHDTTNSEQAHIHAALHMQAAMLHNEIGDVADRITLIGCAAAALAYGVLVLLGWA